MSAIIRAASRREGVAPSRFRALTFRHRSLDSSKRKAPHENAIKLTSHEAIISVPRPEARTIFASHFYRARNHVEKLLARPRTFPLGKLLYNIRPDRITLISYTLANQRFVQASERLDDRSKSRCTRRE